MLAIHGGRDSTEDAVVRALPSGAERERRSFLLRGDGTVASVKDAFASMARNIEAQTGRSVAAWVKIVHAKRLTRHGEIVAWLKSEHGLSHGYANFLALQSIGSGQVAQSGIELVAAQFSGGKSAIRPIYDRVLDAIQAFGPDIEVAPKKHNVSLRRRNQFALLQPSTATRLDIGLVLPGVNTTARLESSGSFNAMFTHRVRVSSVREVDAELIRWLKRAYDAGE